MLHWMYAANARLICLTLWMRIIVMNGCAIVLHMASEDSDGSYDYGMLQFVTVQIINHMNH